MFFFHIQVKILQVFVFLILLYAELFVYQVIIMHVTDFSKTIFPQWIEYIMQYCH